MYVLKDNLFLIKIKFSHNDKVKKYLILEFLTALNVCKSLVFVLCLNKHLVVNIDPYGGTWDFEGNFIIYPLDDLACIKWHQTESCTLKIRVHLNPLSCFYSNLNILYFPEYINKYSWIHHMQIMKWRHERQFYISIYLSSTPQKRLEMLFF